MGGGEIKREQILREANFKIPFNAPCSAVRALLSIVSPLTVHGVVVISCTPLLALAHTPCLSFLASIHRTNDLALGLAFEGAAHTHPHLRHHTLHPHRTSSPPFLFCRHWDTDRHAPASHLLRVHLRRKQACRTCAPIGRVSRSSMVGTSSSWARSTP